jgi:hypothetical protein
MPTYAFRNKETGELTEKFMGISAREEYLTQNPQLETMVNGAPMICDPVRVGARKLDTGFKEVLQKIHERAPGSTLNQGSSQI